MGSVQEKEYSYEEENDDADAVVSAKSTTSQTNSAAREEVEGKKKKTCYFEYCNKEVVVWPFPRTKRESKRMAGYCKSCNEGRPERKRVKYKESRGNISHNDARKKLYGWVQEAPVSFQECTEIPVYTPDQVKLGFFNRDFLHSFVSARRILVGKEGTL